MKTLKSIIALLAISAVFVSCGEKSEDPQAEIEGTVSIEFDNFVGSSQLNLAEDGSTDYTYSTTSGQEFNLTRVQYYVSKIILTGENGEVFEDELNVSANADEVRGYYFIQESESASQILELTNVPEGTYTQITFNLGIDEEGVQEGAAGGILDPATGAPFWNWNAGYIAMTVEGQTSVLEDPEFQIHVGGWKDVIPEDGSTQKFYNNVKTITLNLDVNMQVSSSLEPEIHIVTDIQKVLGAINFSATSAVHSPAAGRTFADNLESAFIVDHVHQ